MGPSPSVVSEEGLADRQWYVVRTKNRKEDHAERELERRGVAVFLPRVLESEREREQVAPLFPGYLFVRIDLVAQYYRVVWTPGVRSFVAFGTVPTPVPEQAVRLIRAGASEAGVIRPSASLRAGDRVQIRSGPLAGLVAVIQRPCSQRGRVQVLLDFLRHGASVDVPVGLVARI
jgi:transcriptional antiterminator RfaH